ncbi:helix-hairpin-helix domain-containing protein [Streptomyces sp. NPDC002454]
MDPRPPARHPSGPSGTMPGTASGDPSPPHPSPADGRPLGRLNRGALSVRERLPLWLRTRCALEWRGLVALTAVLVLAVGLAVHHFRDGRPQPVRVPEAVGPAPPERTAPAASATPHGRRVVVDVGGEVRRPGVLRLPVGARVADALRAAGGVRPGADLTGLNRARVLVDGEQVVVGAPPTGPPPGAAGTTMPGGSGPTAPTGPVPLSTATAEQLDALPGVGPVLARRIIDHREAHGAFRSVEQLREVTGIGERRYADLKDLVQP